MTGPAAPFAAAAAEGREYFEAAAEALALLPETAGPGASPALLLRHYAESGTLTPLSSEVERTFDARLEDGRRYILKTSSRPHAIEGFRFQAAVLAGLDGAEGILAPQALATVSGALLFEQDGVSGYLQSWIDGMPLHEVPQSPRLLRAVGAALARLNLAMADLRPPAARRPVLWNIACWPWLRELERHLPADRPADLARAALADYAERLAPQVAELDWQVTHNDPSPYNMIETIEGVAFIDFGDGGWNPRLQDLAIAAGHFVSDAAMPLGGAEHVIAGYAAVAPLSDREVALLPGLMRARQGALMLVNHWRSHLFPAAAPYIMKNVHRAALGLTLLDRLDAAAGTAAVRAAVALEAA